MRKTNSHTASAYLEPDQDQRLYPLSSAFLPVLPAPPPSSPPPPRPLPLQSGSLLQLGPLPRLVPAPLLASLLLLGLPPLLVFVPLLVSLLLLVLPLLAAGSLLEHSLSVQLVLKSPTPPVLLVFPLLHLGSVQGKCLIHMCFVFLYLHLFSKMKHVSHRKVL